MRPVKILIIQTAFLGDVVLTLPMVKSIKNNIPDSVIHFLCIPETANALANNPYIDKILTFDKRGKKKYDHLFKIILDVREELYDVVICPHRSYSSAFITYFTKAAVKIGFDRNSLSYILTHKVPYDSNAHEIQRNLSLVFNIPDLTIDEKKFSYRAELFPSEKDKIIVSKILIYKKFIAFAPCSKWFTKQITIGKSKEFIKVLIDNNYNLVLTGGAEDFNYCKQLENMFEGKILNLAARLTPLQSYEMLTYASLLISTDSAAMHLGTAAGIPIAVIYGSTNKSFGFYPLTVPYKIIENKELTCRPCTDHGKVKCPLVHFKCIMDLRSEEVVEAVKEIIKR